MENPQAPITLADLDEELLLDDAYFKASRDSVIFKGLAYKFTKPPYMPFKEQTLAQEKLEEAYQQQEFLILFGYSGCGKTTMLERFSSRYPHYVHLINGFSYLSPSRLIQKIGNCLGKPLKARTNDLETLLEHLNERPEAMFLFDNVDIHDKNSSDNLNNLCTIYKETHTPICICGVNRLYNVLYDEHKFEKYCSALTPLDHFPMKGMRREDAARYLKKVEEDENVRFPYTAEQLLINICMSYKTGSIHAFTTVIGRCITSARAIYYTESKEPFPSGAQCIRLEDPEDRPRPGAKCIMTLPPTPKPVGIDERLVLNTLYRYKSNFPKVEIEKAVGGRRNRHD